MQHVLQLAGPQAGAEQVWVTELQTAPVEPQLTQAAPPVPQAFVLSPPTHVRPVGPGWQHPLGHVVELQPPIVCFSQTRAASQLVKPPAEQLSHAPPLLPHAVKVVPIWQTPLESQHPPEHVAGPQVSGARHC
jgi:hypothetical protein